LEFVRVAKVDSAVDPESGWSPGDTIFAESTFGKAEQDPLWCQDPLRLDCGGMHMMAGGQEHWDDVYGARSEDALTRFEATPAVSLDLVRDHLRPGEPFIDIGAGASRLVDVLLEEGFGPVTVLDLSSAALAVSRQRLGARGGDVAWIEADITTWEPERTYAVWHDGAVFHFLTAAKDRAGYARALSAALRPGAELALGRWHCDCPGSPPHGAMCRSIWKLFVDELFRSPA
jgi:hypothetical protein